MTHLKKEFRKLSFKDILVFSLATATMLAGHLLLFIGMLIAPEGEIHHSILSAFGIICVFVASLLGISLHYANELKKFKGIVSDTVSRIKSGKEVAKA